MADPKTFMAGVHLFGRMVTQMDDRKLDGAYDIFAEYREQPLQLYLLSSVNELLEQPALAEGFAAALGDYIAAVCNDTSPDNYFPRLTYDEVMEGPAPEPVPQSAKVIAFVSRAQLLEISHG